MVCITIVGPVFYDDTFTGKRYIELLKSTMEEILDNLDLDGRQHVVFQQDGIQLHNSRDNMRLHTDSYIGT